MHNLAMSLPPFSSAALANTTSTMEPDSVSSACVHTVPSLLDGPAMPLEASPYETAAIACLGSKQLLTLAVNLFFRKYDGKCV